MPLRGKEIEANTSDPADQDATQPLRVGGRGTRPRRHRIDVWVTEDERADIADRAAQTGLSLSAYMRAAGLNHPLRVTADLSAVRDLARLHGDLGRVAGLLKLWLASKKGEGAAAADVELMMLQFRELQAEILNAAGRL